MSFWLFKLADQELYPDIPGEKYVFDNTHSVRVAGGDLFIYLDKRNGYAFSAAGAISKVTKRKPTSQELHRTSKIKMVQRGYSRKMPFFVYCAVFLRI